MCVIGSPLTRSDLSLIIHRLTHQCLTVNNVIIINLQLSTNVSVFYKGEFHYKPPFISDCYNHYLYNHYLY